MDLLATQESDIHGHVSTTRTSPRLNIENGYPAVTKIVGCGLTNSSDEVGLREAFLPVLSHLDSFKRFLVSDPHFIWTLVLLNSFFTLKTYLISTAFFQEQMSPNRVTLGVKASHRNPGRTQINLYT